MVCGSKNEALKDQAGLEDQYIILPTVLLNTFCLMLKTVISGIEQ